MRVSLLRLNGAFYSQRSTIGVFGVQIHLAKHSTPKASLTTHIMKTLAGLITPRKLNAS